LDSFFQSLIYALEDFLYGANKILRNPHLLKPLFKLVFLQIAFCIILIISLIYFLPQIYQMLYWDMSQPWLANATAIFLTGMVILSGVLLVLFLSVFLVQFLGNFVFESLVKKILAEKGVVLGKAVPLSIQIMESLRWGISFALLQLGLWGISWFPVVGSAAVLALFGVGSLWMGVSSVSPVCYLMGKRVDRGLIASQKAYFSFYGVLPFMFGIIPFFGVFILASSAIGGTKWMERNSK